MLDRPVIIEKYTSREAVEKRLNDLAKDPFNRYELKFFDTAVDQNLFYFTIVLIWTPPES